MAASTEFGKTLNELIETCIDGKLGFAAAADSVDDPQLKNELMRYSEQRAAFAQELQQMASSAGESARESGSVSGAMHRGWINLKGAIASNDRHAILAECERGEDSAVETYRHALDEPLPPAMAIEIATQYEAIQSAHDRVRDLRDASNQA
jgi:uncharacterized protein (TIGR02284 family)